MKKGFSLLLVAVLLFGIAGCSPKDDGKKETNTDTPTKEETNKELSFDTIKKVYEDNGYTISEETEMAASMIGAKSGFKYKTDKGSLEFYEFDKTSDAYKKAESEGIITLEGFGDFEIVVNNGFAIMKTEYNEEAVKLFQSL
ncbi:MAG: hypothetical protein ACLROI_00370 [Beduini sp.]|uniref:hypothetical protein n=1 Tax=Beduini sp. TaxID=1922300 RepID=UPI0011CAC361